MEDDLKTILHKQQIFCSSLKSYFLRKVTKYQNILLKNGVHLSDQNCDDNFDSLSRYQSFDDHIELIIGQKTASPNVYKTFLKIGNRISTMKLFRWIYSIVQRTKAARVLHHLDGVADDAIKDVIKCVGQELAVAFEYQLCLLDGESEIVKLAQHAGSCIVAYLNSKEANYAPEDLLQAVLEVKPHSSNNKEILKTRTICIDNHPVCLRWKLCQVFKQPGIRTTHCELDKSVRRKSMLATKTDELADDESENSDVLRSYAPDLHQSKEAAKIANADDSRGDRETENKSEFDKNENGEDDNIQAQPFSLDSDRTETRRGIQEMGMDFETDVFTITERSDEASDLKPAENKTSEVEGGDSTTVKKDLNSGKGNVDCFTENINEESVVGPQYSPQGETVLSIKEHPKNLCILNSVCTMHQAEINGEMTDIGLKENKVNSTNENLHYEKIDNIDGFNISISDEVAQSQSGTFDTNVNLLDQPFSHAREDEIVCPTSDSERDLHAPKNTNPRDNDIHIESSDNTQTNTYRSDTDTGSHVCAESLSDIAAVDKSYVFYGCFTPYGAKCRPKIYGYRGPLHIWNEEQRNYSLIYNDSVSLARKHQHDAVKPQLRFHQQYIPKTVCKH